MNGDRERDGVRRVTLSEAAEILGTSKDAVRMRVRRGTLRSDKGEDGRVYVYLDPTADTVHHEPEVEGGDAARELVEVLRAQVEDLRGRLDRETEANRENRRIIAGLIERVPELEAPAREPEARESPLGAEEVGEGSSPGPGRGETEAAGEASERRPWWRRVFGG